MKKILLAAVAVAVLTPTMASAQSAREVRQGQNEVRRDRAEVRHDVRQGNHNEAREGRQELREDRQELREDWRDYRKSHGNQFRRGAYQGPRGYSYRPVNVGFRFAPTYYSQRYWINNPGTYRLPRVGVSQRWVRYGNDAVLVNTRSGQVLRVYRSFFW